KGQLTIAGIVDATAFGPGVGLVDGTNTFIFPKTDAVVITGTAVVSPTATRSGRDNCTPDILGPSAWPLPCSGAGWTTRSILCLTDENCPTGETCIDNCLCPCLSTCGDHTVQFPEACDTGNSCQPAAGSTIICTAFCQSQSCDDVCSANACDPLLGCGPG